jgi:hypothetical protein
MILLGLRAPNAYQGNNRKFLLFYPNDAWKSLFWDVIQAVFLLLTCVLVPFNLAFSDELDAISWYVKLNYSIDFLFFLDILVNFNLAV